MSANPRDSFPVPGFGGERPLAGPGPGRGRDLYEKIPGLEDLLPVGKLGGDAEPESPGLSDDATDAGADASETGPPERPASSRAAALLDRMRGRLDDEAEEEARPPRAHRAAAVPPPPPGPAFAPAKGRRPTPDEAPTLGSTATAGSGGDEPDNPFEEAGMTRGPQRSATRTVEPPRPRPGAAPHPPAPTEGDADRYAIMLDPAGQVHVDTLIGVMAAYLGTDARTARRTIRRGKGLLALGLTRSEALVLESALQAERQPVVTVCIEPRMIYEPPRRVKAIRAGARLVTIEHHDREVELPTDDFFLLHAGLLVESDEPAAADAPPPPPRHFLVCSLFGRSQSGCWRWERPLAADDVARGDRSPVVREFCEAMAGLRTLLRDAQRTPIFDSLADRRLDQKHFFADRESFENYELWQLWTRLGSAG